MAEQDYREKIKKLLALQRAATNTRRSRHS